ncbi:MAG: hypothetical protein M3421_03025 [Bacteroidota bacterium]|nr:hypothetical protein [Bacteroidota bacterium]
MDQSIVHPRGIVIEIGIIIFGPPQPLLGVSRIREQDSSLNAVQKMVVAYMCFM